MLHPSPPAGPLALIRRRPLLSFFVLTNLLSWLAWTPYILSANGLGVWDYHFPELLGTTQLLGVLPGAYLGPIFSALLVTAIADGKVGLRRWARRLWKWRVNWRWYALALLGVPALIILFSAFFTGGQIAAPSMLVLIAFVPGLILQIITTGVAEEPGWRDFALPRLQHKYGPLRGSTILGPLWAVWHLPLFLTEWGNWPNSDWVHVLEFVGVCIAFNYVMTWVFNRTGQSLPLAMLVHVSVNNFISIAWSDMFPTLDVSVAQRVLLISFGLVALLLLIATKGRLGYRVEDLPALERSGAEATASETAVGLPR